MSGLPNRNIDYNQLEYWNERYSQEESFEWCKSYTSFQHLIKKYVKRSDRILILGCGNSALSEDMYRDGYTQITNIDYSPIVIENMRNKTKDRDMKWIVMDITALKFEPDSFDVIIEKATLDSLLVHEHDPWHITDISRTLIDCILKQVSDVLSKDGRFLSITFAQPHFRKLLYCHEHYNWSVDVETFGDGFHFFFYVMTKGQQLKLEDCYLKRQQTSQQPVAFLQDEDQENYLNFIET